MRAQTTFFILCLFFALFFLVNSILSGHTISIILASLLIIFVIGQFLASQKERAKENENSNKGTCEKDSFQWMYKACLVVGILGVFFGPYIFTRHYPFGWDWLDFSQTGDIGDTIGGITAPIVGLISILLLWWTLKEQLKFNDKQDQINNAQQILNDSNRVHAMESHILRLNDNFRFIFAFQDSNREGHGISDLRLLYSSDKSITISIPFSTLENTVAQAHIIESAVSSLVVFLDHSKLSKEEKKASYTMAETFLSSICDFYDKVADGRIKGLTETAADLHYNDIDEEDPAVVLQNKCSTYKQKAEDQLSKCRQKLAE